MLTYQEKYFQLSNISETERIKQERMHEVLVLLEHLVEREEVTVKLILDRLYDVGSINLIDRKFHHRSLNRIVKSIATMTKPVFRVFALRWFKKNCPKLIADWLHQQVSFSMQSNQLQSEIKN